HRHLAITTLAGTGDRHREGVVSPRHHGAGVNCWAPTSARVQTLPLRELEPLAGPGTTGLLALHHSGIASEQAGSAQLGAVLLVGLAQRPGNGVAHRAGLAGDTATIDVRLDVEGTQRVGRRERLL